MTKHSEPIPFMGIVEVDDDEDDTHPMTRVEVAQELGVTRHAVRLTEIRALRKFRELFLKKFNKDDFI